MIDVPIEKVDVGIAPSGFTSVFFGKHGVHEFNPHGFIVGACHCIDKEWLESFVEN